MVVCSLSPGAVSSDGYGAWPSHYNRKVNVEVGFEVPTGAL